VNLLWAERWWVAVEAVAAELLAREYLSARTTRRVIRDAIYQRADDPFAVLLAQLAVGAEVSPR
jgi:hypothetical protein